MAPKKRKISGLSGIKLEQAIRSLTLLKQSIVLNEGAEGNADDDEPATGEIYDSQMAQGLTDMIAMLQSRRDGPQALSFSGVNDKVLQQLNIVRKSGLKLKTGIEKLIEESRLVGKDELWCSANMYHHLTLLERLVPRANEASARVWIDAFFFRASAMVSTGHRMLLNIEYNIPATNIHPSSLGTLSGAADYTAVIAEDAQADQYLDVPTLQTARSLCTGFFVTEAKGGTVFQHIAQALCEMYASGRQLGKDTIRGALTNGHDWFFLILTFNKDGQGASYEISPPIGYTVSLNLAREKTVEQPWPDIIAGILSHWIQRSYDELDDDDWLERHPKN